MKKKSKVTKGKHKVCGLQRCIVVSKSRTMLPNVFLQRNHLISDTKQAKIQKCNCRKTRERQTYSGWYGRIWALSTWYSHQLSPIQVLARHYPTYLLTSEKLVLCWLCDGLEICSGWYICKWWQFWFLIPTKMEKSTIREFSPHSQSQFGAKSCTFFFIFSLCMFSNLHFRTWFWEIFRQSV